MSSDPAVVIFDANPSSGTLPAGSDLLQSWKHGPEKMKSFSRRGRPRKHLAIQCNSQANTAHTGRTIPKAKLNNSALSHYEFIACQEPSGNEDPVTRKTIRSHVMHHRSRLKQDESRVCCEAQNDLNRSVRRTRESQDVREYLEARMGTNPAIRLDGFSTFDPFDCMSFRIQPYMLEILSKYTTCSYERLYSIEKYTDYNPMRDYFLPMAFQDLALFHAIIFSSVCLKTLTPKYREVPKAVTHLRECIRLVNERLRSPSLVIDDGTIVIVLMVASSEKLTGHHKNWEVHMNGLKQMIQLRGGLKNLQSNQVLHSLIMRVDIYGSIDAISEPYFDDVVVSVTSDTWRYYISEGFQDINSRVHFRNEFNQILCKVGDSTIELNNIHAGNTTTNPLDLRDCLTSIQYVLLRMELSRHSFQESDAEHICRLGLLLYLVTILNNLLPGASLCDMFASKLRATLEEMSGETRITLGLRWWLALLIGGTASDETNKAWARMTFKQMIRDSESCRREDLKAVLMRFFWVELIHGEKFYRLWDEAVGIEEDLSGRSTGSQSRPSSQVQELVEGRRCDEYGEWLGSLREDD